jgi:hypothetical protein
MAGSYNHTVTDDGNLGTNEFVVDMLENGGDVFEAVEEMHGMIWFLAWQSVAPHLSLEHFKSLQYAREMIKDVVETARRNYTVGLEASKAIHRLSPDNRREGDNE